jgi:hypothetical protein
MAQPTDLSRSFGTPHPQPRFWLARLLAERGVQLALVAWVVSNALALVLARGTLPFDRPTLAGQTVTAQLMFANVALLEVFCLMGVVYGLTRKRVAPNLAARAPARAIARRETLLLLTYGALGQLGGFVLGRALGWHAISFHLAGTLYGTHDLVRPAEVFVWVGYNFIVYAVAPFFFFRRRYSAEALNLTSLNRRNDTVVIVVVLVLEALVELVASSAAILQLRPHQLLLGAPLTFMVYFAGTVLPTMIFVYAILNSALSEAQRVGGGDRAARRPHLRAAALLRRLDGLRVAGRYGALDDLSALYLFRSRHVQNCPDAAHRQCLGPCLGLPCVCPACPRRYPLLVKIFHIR